MSKLPFDTPSEWEKELHSVIGLGALLVLEREYGGQYLYINEGKPSEDIQEAIGEEAGQRLAEHYGGSEIYIPRVSLLRARNIQIQQGRNTGKSVIELAAEFRLSRRRVRAILKEKYGYADSAFRIND